MNILKNSLIARYGNNKQADAMFDDLNNNPWKTSFEHSRLARILLNRNNSAAYTHFAVHSKNIALRMHALDKTLRVDHLEHLSKDPDYEIRDTAKNKLKVYHREGIKGLKSVQQFSKRSWW